MKNITSALHAHLQGEVTTLATCWKLIRRDGLVLGFTDHDSPIVIEGVIYEAETGFTPTAVAASSSLSVDNLDVEGMLDAESITELDIMAGKYDFAEIEIFQVSYQEPEIGKLILRRGWLGEISVSNKRFVAEVRGMTQKLSQQVGQLYSPACRAELGDTRCKVALEAFSFDGVVEAVQSRSIFTDSARIEENGGAVRDLRCRAQHPPLLGPLRLDQGGARDHGADLCRRDGQDGGARQHRLARPGAHAYARPGLSGRGSGDPAAARGDHRRVRRPRRKPL